MHGFPLLCIPEHLDPLAKERSCTQSPPLLSADILEARVVPFEVLSQQLCCDLEAVPGHLDDAPLDPGWRGRVFACEGLQSLDCEGPCELEELADEGQPFAVSELLLCALLLTATATVLHVVPEGREEGRGAVECDVDAVQAVATSRGRGEDQCAQNVPPIERGENDCVERNVKVEAYCCEECVEQVDYMVRHTSCAGTESSRQRVRGWHGELLNCKRGGRERERGRGRGRLEVSASFCWSGGGEERRGEERRAPQQ